MVAVKGRRPQQQSITPKVLPRGCFILLVSEIAEIFNRRGRVPTPVRSVLRRFIILLRTLFARESRLFVASPRLVCVKNTLNCTGIT